MFFYKAPKTLICPHTYYLPTSAHMLPAIDHHLKYIQNLEQVFYKCNLLGCRSHFPFSNVAHSIKGIYSEIAMKSHLISQKSFKIRMANISIILKTEIGYLNQCGFTKFKINKSRRKGDQRFKKKKVYNVTSCTQVLMDFLMGLQNI